MTEHPIVLDNVFFTRFNVVAIPGFDSNAENPVPRPDNNINLARIEDQPGLFAGRMTTVLNASKEDSCPYFVDVECVCYLRADLKQLSDEEALRGAMITAHSVLYGAIREAVAWLTGRQPHGSLMLGLSVLRSNQPSTKEKK